jgi:hypothetical protein
MAQLRQGRLTHVFRIANPTPRGHRHSESSPECDAQGANHYSCPTRACHQATGKSQEHQRSTGDNRYNLGWRGYGGDQKVHDCPNGEAASRCQAAESDAHGEASEMPSSSRACADRVVGHQLLGSKALFLVPVLSVGLQMSCQSGLEGSKKEPHEILASIGLLANCAKLSERVQVSKLIKRALPSRVSKPGSSSVLPRVGSRGSERVV